MGGKGGNELDAGSPPGRKLMSHVGGPDATKSWCRSRWPGPPRAAGSACGLVSIRGLLRGDRNPVPAAQRCPCRGWVRPFPGSGADRGNCRMQRRLHGERIPAPPSASFSIPPARGGRPTAVRVVHRGGRPSPRAPGRGSPCPGGACLARGTRWLPRLTSWAEEELDRHCTGSRKTKGMCLSQVPWLMAAVTREQLSPLFGPCPLVTGGAGRSVVRPVLMGTVCRHELSWHFQKMLPPGQKASLSGQRLPTAELQNAVDTGSSVTLCTRGWSPSAGDADRVEVGKQQWPRRVGNAEARMGLTLADVQQTGEALEER